MALHRPPRRHINQLRAKIGEIEQNSRSIAAPDGKHGLVRKLDQLIETGVERRDRIFPHEDAQARAFLEWFEPVFLADLRHL